MKWHDLKQKCLKWHISARDTHLNFGEEFGNRCNEIPYKQLRHVCVNTGNTFLLLCFSSWILVIAVFLPEPAHVRENHCFVFSKSLLFLTSSILNKSCLEEVLEPLWDTPLSVLCLLPMAETTWFFRNKGQNASMMTG